MTNTTTNTTLKTSMSTSSCSSRGYFMGAFSLSNTHSPQLESTTQIYPYPFDSITDDALQEIDSSTRFDRRSAHNALERQRREHLNNKFQQLAHALPSLQTVRRPTKTMIVSKSLEFVSTTMQREKNYKNQILALRKENERLRKQARGQQQQQQHQHEHHQHQHGQLKRSTRKRSIHTDHESSRRPSTASSSSSCSSSSVSSLSTSDTISLLASPVPLSGAPTPLSSCAWSTWPQVWYPGPPNTAVDAISVDEMADNTWLLSNIHQGCEDVYSPLHPTNLTAMQQAAFAHCASDWACESNMDPFSFHTMKTSLLS